VIVNMINTLEKKEADRLGIAYHPRDFREFKK